MNDPTQVTAVTVKRITDDERSELLVFLNDVAVSESRAQLARAQFNHRVAELLQLYHVPPDSEIDAETGEIRPRKR